MKMVLRALAALAFTLTISSCTSQTNAPRPIPANSADDVLAPVRQYQRASVDPNADAAAYAAVLAPDHVSYLHALPSYFWNIPALEGRPNLEADLARDVQMREITAGAQGPLLAPKVLHIEGDRAYAVVPETGISTFHGRHYPYSGTYILGLTHTTAGWRIAAFVWQDAPATIGYSDASPSDAAPVIAAVRSYFASDLSAAPPALAADGAIIDEFAPFYWQGPSAALDWWKALQKLNAASHVTSLRIALDAPDRILMNGGHAYVVVPAHLTFLTKGNPSHEDGLFTIALEKDAHGWLIDAWAWSPPRG